MFQNRKFKQYQKIIFVDSENVGYRLPQIIPKDVFIFLFISDLHVFNKIKDDHHKQIEIISLSTLSEKKFKNAMDFCIITKLCEILSITSAKQELIILSKDKGYDVSIQYLLNENCKRKITRLPLSPIQFCMGNHELTNILEKASDKTLKAIHLSKNMEELKKVLSKNQKLIFTIFSYQDFLTQTNVYIEYDIYECVYVLYIGSHKDKFLTLNQAQTIFYRYIHQLGNEYKISIFQRMFHIKMSKLHQLIS